MESSQLMVSTYVHVTPQARVSCALDSSTFGVSASLRLGSHGEHDAILFFRNPEQLERLAEDAKRAAEGMRQAVILRDQLQTACEIR